LPRGRGHSAKNIGDTGFVSADEESGSGLADAMITCRGAMEPLLAWISVQDANEE